VPPTGPTLAAGVDTIDVIAAGTEVFALNHSGYAENNDLLNDVGTLIEKGVHPPQSRSEKRRSHRRRAAIGAASLRHARIAPGMTLK
jgi:hypothetical protein